MSAQSKIYLRMLLYILITALITFATLLDSFTNAQIELFKKFDWIKLTFKAFIPSLVSLKAFLDNTVNENLYKSQITTPQYNVSTQDILQGLSLQTTTASITSQPILTTFSTITTAASIPSDVITHSSPPKRFPRAT